MSESKIKSPTKCSFLKLYFSSQILVFSYSHQIHKNSQNSQKGNTNSFKVLKMVKYKLIIKISQIEEITESDNKK